MPPRTEPLYRILNMNGLDKEILTQGLKNELGYEFDKVFKLFRCSGTGLRINLQALLKTIVDHYPLYMKEIDLFLGLLGDQVKWTANVSNAAIFSLIDTVVAARRKWNSTNGETHQKLHGLVLLVQHIIDLEDGKVKYEPQQDFSMQAKLPSRDAREFMNQELARLDAQQRIEAERNQYDMEDDELKENVDYPEDNDDTVAMVDPDVELSDPRTGIPLPPDDVVPDVVPTSTPKTSAANRPTRRNAPRTSQGSSSRAPEGHNRVQKRTPAANKAKESIAKKARHTNIFEDFFKNNPKPFILPIHPAPSNRPEQRPIPANFPLERPARQPMRRCFGPETGALTQIPQTQAIGNETAKKLPRTIPQPEEQEYNRLLPTTQRVEQAVRPEVPQAPQNPGRPLQALRRPGRDPVSSIFRNPGKGRMPSSLRNTGQVPQAIQQQGGKHEKQDGKREDRGEKEDGLFVEEELFVQ